MKINCKEITRMFLIQLEMLELDVEHYLSFVFRVSRAGAGIGRLRTCGFIAISGPCRVGEEGAALLHHREQVHGVPDVGVHEAVRVAAGTYSQDDGGGLRGCNAWVQARLRRR